MITNKPIKQAAPTTQALGPPIKNLFKNNIHSAEALLYTKLLAVIVCGIMVP